MKRDHTWECQYLRFPCCSWSYFRLYRFHSLSLISSQKQGDVIIESFEECSLHWLGKFFVILWHSNFAFTTMHTIYWIQSRGQLKPYNLCCSRSSILIPYFHTIYTHITTNQEGNGSKLVWHSQFKYKGKCLQNSFSLQGVYMELYRLRMLCNEVFLVHCFLCMHS